MRKSMLVATLAMAGVVGLKLSTKNEVQEAYEIPRAEAKMNLPKIVSAETVTTKNGAKKLKAELQKIREQAPVNTANLARSMRIERFEKNFQDFRSVDRVALKSEKQRKQWEDLLSNRRFLTQSYLILAELNKEVSKGDRNDLSMDAVDVLNTALAWRDNPARREVIRKMSSLLIQEISVEADGLELAKTKAGNKVELYLSLKKHDPEAANQLKHRARSSRLSQLIAFAEANFK